MVHPQRPTFAPDTETTAPGTFELEAGLSVDPGDGLDSPLLLKWGLSEDAEVTAGFSPLRIEARPGRDAEGVGDLRLGVRHRFVEALEDRPSAAFLVEAKLPTAPSGGGLGSGETDLRAGLVLHARRRGFAWKLFGSLGALGDPDGPGLDVEWALAFGLERPFGGGWKGFGELSLVAVPERDFEPFTLLVGAARRVSADLVLDFSLGLGLSDDAPDLRLLLGLTTNLGGPLLPPD